MGKFVTFLALMLCPYLAFADCNLQDVSAAKIARWSKLLKAEQLTKVEYNALVESQVGVIEMSASVCNLPQQELEQIEFYIRSHRAR